MRIKKQSDVYYNKEDMMAIANWFIRKLREKGIGAQISSRSWTSNSVYLKFDNYKLRDFTIRDHDTKAGASPKWNFRTDTNGKRWFKDKAGKQRCVYGIDSRDVMIRDIVKFNKKVGK